MCQAKPKSTISLLLFMCWRILSPRRTRRYSDQYHRVQCKHSKLTSWTNQVANHCRTFERRSTKVWKTYLSRPRDQLVLGQPWQTTCKSQAIPQRKTLPRWHKAPINPSNRTTRERTENRVSRCSLTLDEQAEDKRNNPTVLKLARSRAYLTPLRRTHRENSKLCWCCLQVLELKLRNLWVF